MSYILDALRKADAERERDPARGIHAQPAAGIPQRAPSRSRAWGWPAAALVVAVAAAWGFRGRTPETVTVSAPPTVMPVPAALTMAPPAKPAVLPVVASSVTPPPPAAVENMAAKVVIAPRVPAAHAPVPGMPSAAPLAVAPPSTVAAPVVAVAPPTAPAMATTPVAAASAPAASDRIVALTELPADVQHGLPKLAISGGVYSENVAQRMLIVGGQVMSEGQELAPGVLLEQIRPRSAVLRYRNYRYSVAY